MFTLAQAEVGSGRLSDKDMCSLLRPLGPLLREDCPAEAGPPKMCPARACTHAHVQCMPMGRLR